MNKFNPLNYNINPQPIPSTYNDGYSQYETLSKLLYLVNEYIENMNLGADEIETLKTQKQNITDYLNDIKNNRKLDERGNFTGTWNGLPMSSTNEGLATDIENAKGSFETVTALIDDMLTNIESNSSNLSNMMGQIKTFKVLDTNTTINVPSDFTTVQLALDSLKNTFIPKDITVTINVASGLRESSTPITINHPCSRQIEIIGANVVSTTISDIVGVVGSLGNWNVSYTVGSTSGISLGDYVIIKNTTGTGDHYSHWGCWKVVNIDSSNQITVQNTNRKSVFPTATVTTGTLIAIKTIFKFNNSLGVVVEPGNSLGKIDNCVVVGDINNSQYGLVVGSYVDLTRPNLALPGTAAVRTGQYFGVNGFKRSGVWAGYGGSVFVDLSGNASCNNGEHGWEADSGGHISTGWGGSPSLVIGNGNIGCGLISYNGSAIWSNLTVACGNGTGISASVSSGIVLGTAYANSNTTSGFYSRKASHIDMSDNCQATYNSNYGFYAEDGGHIRFGSNALSDHNGTHGIYAINTSSIQGVSATSSYNGGGGFASYNGASIWLTSSSTSNNNTGSGYAVNSGTLVSGTANSHHNSTHGFWCVSNGVMRVSGSTANANSVAGYTTDDSGRIIADGSTSTGHASSYGYQSFRCSYINAKNSTASGNLTDYYASKMSYIDANAVSGTPTYNPALNTNGNSNSIISS